MKTLPRLLIIAAYAGVSVVPVFAQSSSGTITGRVVDSSGQAVPGATVTLVRTDVRDVRSLVTPTSGDVVFTSLQPGPYMLQVELAGFAKLERTNLTLSASERLAVGDLVLTVGAVTETIVVESGPAPIQTTSSERGALIDANQITELPTRGRDVFGLMATLPGVVYDGRGSDLIGTAGSPAAFSGTRGDLQHRQHRRRVGQRAQRLQPGHDRRHGYHRRGQGPAEQLSSRFTPPTDIRSASGARLFSATAIGWPRCG